VRAQSVTGLWCVSRCLLFFFFVSSARACPPVAEVGDESQIEFQWGFLLPKLAWFSIRDLDKVHPFPGWLPGKVFHSYRFGMKYSVILP
jgi:hypothetical protein